ncbi:phosphoribosylglycinamide formyltransferase [Candidatus Gracilibacteria bacterium]|nr:phosphoribosylglycinamide formyltransferase [Candidatus Gracilibacteria bacterium]
MYKIVVLASTNGTDLQAIIDEMKAGKMSGISLEAVISNKENCGAMQKAKDFGTQAIHIPQDDYEQNLLNKLQEINPDLIVMIGYMKILSPEITKAFHKKIINVHPALIPKYSGKNFYGKSVHEAVLEAKETESGMTIHYVDEGVDTGEIILQKTCTIDDDETPESLKEKVQALEKKYYPQVIREFAAAHIDL